MRNRVLSIKRDYASLTDGIRFNLDWLEESLEIHGEDMPELIAAYLDAGDQYIAGKRIDQIDKVLNMLEEVLGCVQQASNLMDAYDGDLDAFRNSELDRENENAV